MDLTLLHVSEFYSWAATSYLRMDVGRVLTINLDSNENVQTLFDSYGHILISEPESYLVATLTADWRHSLLRPARTTSGSVSVFPLEVVEEFHALTDDARLRLGSQTERLSVVLGDTKLEQFWRKYQISEKLAQDHAAGRVFLSLFKFPASSESKFSGMRSLSVERLNELLTRITDYNDDKRLQTVKQTAEYGLFEFGIRLANSFAKEWRSNDIGYARFREVRSRYLKDKSWDSVSYLDYSEVVASLVALDDLAKETIGVDPFAGACFFLNRAKYELSGRRSVDFASLTSDAKKLISLDRPESCLQFLYLVGCNLGLEVVSKIRYHLNAEKFPTIKSESINRNLNDLNAHAFDLTSRCLDRPANQSESRDQGEGLAVTPIGVVPYLILNGRVQPTVIESVGQTKDVKAQSANSRTDLAITSLGGSTVSELVKVETAKPSQTETAAAPLVSEPIQIATAISTPAEAETPAQSSFLKSDVEPSAGEKTAGGENKRKPRAKFVKKVVPKSA